MTTDLRVTNTVTGLALRLAGVEIGPDLAAMLAAVSGPVIAIPPDALLFTSPGFITSAIIFAAPARPLQLLGRVRPVPPAVGTRFVQLFNKATPLVNGDTAAIVDLEVGASDPFSLVIAPNVFTLGIGIASSTTPVVLTLAPAPSDLFVSLWYRP
jgi:hypothetical protein